MVWSDNFNITKTKTSKGNSGRAPLAEERCLLPACEHKLPTISQLRLTASYQMSAKGTKPFSRDRLINLMASIRKKKNRKDKEMQEAHLFSKFTSPFIYI